VGTTCVQGLVGLGTPVLWWVGALAMVDAVYLMLAKRDWRFSVPVLGVITTWWPWLLYGDRPIYAYYAVAIIPFTVIGLVLVLARFALPKPGDFRRFTPGRMAVVALVVAVMANFAWEWPVLTDQVLTTEQYAQRVFLPNWRLFWNDTFTTPTPGGPDAVVTSTGAPTGSTGATH